MAAFYVCREIRKSWFNYLQDDFILPTLILIWIISQSKWRFVSNICCQNWDLLLLLYTYTTKTDRQLSRDKIFPSPEFLVIKYSNPNFGHTLQIWTKLNQYYWYQGFLTKKKCLDFPRCWHSIPNIPFILPTFSCLHSYITYTYKMYLYNIKCW